MHKGWYKELEENDENGFAQFGGYMEAKKAKLIKQVCEQAGTERHSTIFKGISIYVNGFTKPLAEELKTLMGLHGGIYHVYQMPSTTHVIASNLPNVKINKLGPLPIVKPSWIEDSITLGRLLDYTKYLLYTNHSRTQPKINFDKVSNSLNVTNSRNAPIAAKTASDPSFLSEFYGNSRLHLIATLGADMKQFVNVLRDNRDQNHEFEGLQRLQTAKSMIYSRSSTLENKLKEDEFRDDDDLSEVLQSPHLEKLIKGDDLVKEVIMHIDMDCFFVSVGIRNRPELKGKPVAVTHSKTGQGRTNVDRSVEIAMYKDRLPDGAEFRLQDIDDNSSLSEIASCSYEARKMGVKNGMFMGQAIKLCPDLKAIPYDFNDYKQVSKVLYTTISEYTLNIEAVSCDEMYVNITSLLQTSLTTVDVFADHIRSVIKQRTGCPCSTGFGSNRLQARLATKRAKPDGHYYLLPSDVANYMGSMHLSELPGVGRALLGKMKNLGLETCGDVQLFSLPSLQKEIGVKMGETVFEQCAGIDKRPLQYEHERKSVSAEVNYGIRFKTKEESWEFLQRLALEVRTRLVETGMKAKCITLKLMVRAEDAPIETAKYLGHGICNSMSKSTSLRTATDAVEIIAKESRLLLDKMNIIFSELRGVGIQLSKLEKAHKMETVLKNFLGSKSLKENIITDEQKAESKAGNLPKSKVSNVKKLPKTVSEVTGRKTRGRPSKNQTVAASGKSKNVTDFFMSTRKDRIQKPSNRIVSHRPQSETINLSVLAELPEDIRLDVIREYNLFHKQEKVEVKNMVKESPLDIASPPKKKSNTARVTMGFESLSHADFMVMLENWFQSHSKPLEFDVDMLGKYFQEMASQRLIERLFIYVKYLHRNINEKNDCDWRHAYYKVVDMLQIGMRNTYGNILRVPTQFSCANIQ